MRRLVSIVFFALSCLAAFSQNNAADSLYLDSIYRHLELEEYTIEGNVSSAEDVKALAELPSREGLLSMLLSVLQAPVRNFALATKAVAEQKEEQGA